jgi:hypothetical protein
MWRDLALLIGVVCIVAYAKGYLEREGFTDCERKDIVFYSASETAKFLSSDPDNYVHTLTPMDLYARKQKTVDAYLTTAAGAAMDFDTSSKVRLSKAVSKADAFFHRQGHDIIENMQWVFALTQGSVYEDGLPHTRANIIFLSQSVLAESDDDLCKTLVHEKLHIFQRANPEKMAPLLDSAGYVRWKYRVGEPRIRANPDLDPWIYIDPDTKAPMIAHYSSDTPRSISDVNESPSDEHPFERMAYELVKRLG